MAQLLLANPRRRKRRRRVSPPKQRRRRVTRSYKPIRRRRYKRNPIGGMGGMAGKFMDGAIGGLGAVAVDVAMQKLPIPAQFTTGPMGAAAKGIVGLGLGMMAGKVLGRGVGNKLAQGAITVAMYSTTKELIGPAMGLSGDGLLYYDNNSDMGYYNVSQTYEPMVDGMDDDDDDDLF